MSLRERVLGRIRQELALHEASAPRKWFPLSREVILYPALLAEAQRQVEKHGPMRAQDDCRMCSIDCGCTTSYTPMDLCPVVLAWARVFGEGE